jgi:TetR/AcrR family transcriptional regulator, fatty acid metabolism regulator protein
MIKEITHRQQELIEAAGRILTRAGVSGLTIKNLAAEMQFSEAAVYRHFASKEDVVIAMLDYLAENMDQRLQSISKTAQGPEEKLKSIFQNQFDFFAGNPHFVVAVFSDGLLEESQRINAAIVKIMGVKMRHLMPVIMTGQQTGVFTNAITTEELMHIVMGTFRLQMFKWRLADFQFDIKRQSENMMSALLTLIRQR